MSTWTMSTLQERAFAQLTDSDPNVNLRDVTEQQFGQDRAVSWW